MGKLVAVIGRKSIAGQVKFRLRQLKVRCETLTKDNVTIVASVQCQEMEEKANDMYYNLSNQKSQNAINSQLKNGIAKSVEEELEKAMFAYGHETAQTLIVDIEPDRKVKRATNEINDEAEAKYVSGGIARQLQAILYGFRDSVLGFSGNVAGTSAKDVVDMIRAAYKSSAVFLPHGPGGVADIPSQICNGLLQEAS
ncbi:hypothetical protein BRADI_3g28137v3 [Brachypodium distachyon]|uniref:Band 7 domain-containing protein n=1 Tax=Brachypodium distachyon TaxID=15368 RepID=A0A0Q3I9F3_BRADI|nr:hypothetical protein BRADI_3g28137v3 [Brachypodium distachyon]